MKTAADIIEEINNENKEKNPNWIFWTLLGVGSFAFGVLVAMVYAYITSPIAK